MGGNSHSSVNDYSHLSREELVREYLSVKLADLVNFIGVDWHWMPKDVSQDPEYWKKIDGDLWDMHHEIARRYHITHDECLWLENMVDSDNMYIFKRQFNVIVKKAIESLEKAEAKKLDGESR